MLGNKKLLALAVAAVLAASTSACGGRDKGAKSPAGVATAAPSASATPADPSTNAKQRVVNVSAVNECSTVKGSPETVALLEKACTAKDWPGCFELGLRYLCGAGVAQDTAKATRLNEQACDGGVIQACGNAALAHMQLGDLARAYVYADKGCTGGDVVSCNNLGGLLMNASGPNANPPRAAQIFAKLCEKGNQMSCGNLATMYWLGLGVPRDLVKAKSMADGACAAGISGGCNTLAAIVIDEPGGGPRAVTLFNKVCTIGDPNGCDNLGQVLSRGMPGVAANKEQASAAFKRACDMNFAKGCTHLAQLLSQ